MPEQPHVLTCCSSLRRIAPRSGRVFASSNASSAIWTISRLGGPAHDAFEDVELSPGKQLAQASLLVFEGRKRVAVVMHARKLLHSGEPARASVADRAASLA